MAAPSRRTKRRLGARLAPKKLGYFNSLLSSLAAAHLLGRMRPMTGRHDSDDSPPPKVVNSLFETIFRLERHLVGRVPMSPGVSIITLAMPKS